MSTSLLSQVDATFGFEGWRAMSNPDVFELWRDQKSLNAWRKVAKGARVKIRKASVNLYRPDKAEKPF